MPNNPYKMTRSWWIKELGKMNQLELAELEQYAPEGHFVFSDPILRDTFRKRFREAGGMTDEISDIVGRR